MTLSRHTAQEAGIDPDAAHEDAIQACFERWMNGEKCWSELAVLLNSRSPEQILKMEHERGLV